MIKSKTVYTKELLDEFSSFIIKKNKSLIVIYVCAAIILACAIAMFFLGKIVDGVLYLIIGIFFACYGLVLKFVLSSSQKKVYGNYEEYEFYDDYMLIKTYDKSGEHLSSGTMKYEYVYKLYLNKTRAYILISKYNAYIIDKNNFSSENDFNDVINKINYKFNKQVVKEKK